MAYSIGSSLVNLEETLDDEVLRLVLGQAATHQVEDLIRADLPDRGLVGHGGVVFLDVDVGIRVAAALVIEHQRVAADTRHDIGGAPPKPCPR